MANGLSTKEQEPLIGMRLLGLLHASFAAVALAVSNTTFSTKGSTIQYPVTVNGINLLSASAAEIVTALESGVVTTLQLVDAYIARIEANDHQGMRYDWGGDMEPSDHFQD
jgi:predicted aspartyl protease